MTISVLISCMHQNNAEIIKRSNVKTNAVVINQCNKDNITDTIFKDAVQKEHKLRFVDTRERGLSKSRNMAIKNANEDICLIMDDDEVLENDYVTTIQNAYTQYPDADIIVFQLGNSNKKYAKESKQIGYLRALKVSSLEISFKRQSIINKDIKFDIEMGSGTGNGAGEENAFLYACLKKGLKIQYVPKKIASLNIGSQSQWFQGYTKQYFYKRGWATERYMGKTMATLYAIYFTAFKYKIYKKDCSLYNAIKNMLSGIYGRAITCHFL